MHATLSAAQNAQVRRKVANANRSDESEGELNVVPFLDIVMNVVMFLLASITTRERYYQTVFLPIPDKLMLSNYVDLVANCTKGCILVSMQLTVIRVVWYVLVTLVVATFAGYAFGKLRFPGRNALFLFLLTGMMVPGILTLLPVYIMLARWPLAGGNDIIGQGGHGFVNEWQALFMLGLVDVVAIFLIKQNYEMIPNDYEEAALVDGASFLNIIFRVYVPMLRPAFTAIAAATFWWTGLYRGIWRYASLPDLLALLRAVSVVVLVFFPLMFVATRLVDLPRSLVGINWLVLMALLGALCYAAIIALNIFGGRMPDVTMRAQLFLVSVGVLFSAYLAYIELFVLHTICPWCVISTILIGAIMALSVWELRDASLLAAAE